ncbi:MAG: hypothetical protein AAGA87_07915 [Pseudomonadota bacterium]
MRSIWQAIHYVLPHADPFAVIGLIGALQQALAVVLFERLLRVRYALPLGAAVCAAGVLALSYGPWRFAAEVEVYSTVTLISVAVFWAASAISHGKRLLFLGVAAGLAPMVYQPLGILGGLIVPIILFGRVSWRALAGYLAVFSVVVIAGILAANLIETASASGRAAQAIFDTDGTRITAPDLDGVLKTLIGFGQNSASVNWAFELPFTRGIIEKQFAERFEGQLFATNVPTGFAWIVFATLPVLLALLVAGLLYRGRPAKFRRLDLAALIWVMTIGGMIVLLAPRGFEAWIPATVPAVLLFASRVAGPLAEAGRLPLLVAMVGVLAVHNALAGLALVGGADRNYLAAKGDPVLAQVGAADTIVTGQWRLDRYLAFTSDVTVVMADETGDGLPDVVRAALQRGGSVWVYEDAWQDDLGAHEALDLPRAGRVYRIDP